MNQCESQVRAIKKMCLREISSISEYQPVEYLASSGTQYIVTGVPIAGYVETRCKGMLTDGNADYVSLVGGRNNNNNNGRYIVFSPQSSKLRLTYGDTNVNTSYASANKLYTIVFNDASHKVYINGSQATSFSGKSISTSGQQHIALFGLSGYNGTNVSWNANGRLYSVSFYNNSTGDKLGDYIPCYRKSDNKPGMYDLVTKTFFTNEGTGEFTVGADI